MSWESYHELCFRMNIVNQHHELMSWVQNHYGSYDAWYQHIHSAICNGQEYCTYEIWDRAACLRYIAIYNHDIESYFEFLHPWSYSIVSRQVKIDLLYHHLFVIKTEELMKKDLENSKKEGYYS